MAQGYKGLEAAITAIREKTDFVPETALVLGSGLGGFAERIDVKAEVEYTDIEGFPVSTVAGHEGKFIFGYVKEVPVVVMKGRVHYYEGYEMEDVVMPIRLMGMLGAKTLILTNAAGSVNLDYKPGDLMIIEDQISAFVPSPLRGRNIEELGTRFPDMSSIYDREIQDKIEEIAKELKVSVKKGIYLQWQGPNYESPAEIRMFRGLGADAIGMSTACEAIAARHMGLRVCGISCLTNMAAGILDQPLDHKEVQEVANQVKDAFEALVSEMIARI